jgi:hypothetical protein
MRVTGHSEMWVLSMKSDSYHLPGAYNLDVDPKFGGNLWAPLAKIHPKTGHKGPEEE